MLARVPIQAWTKPRVAETSQQRQNGRESTQESSRPPRLNLALIGAKGGQRALRLLGEQLTAFFLRPICQSRSRRESLSAAPSGIDTLSGDIGVPGASLPDEENANTAQRSSPRPQRASIRIAEIKSESVADFPWNTKTLFRSNAGRSPAVQVWIQKR